MSGKSQRSIKPLTSVIARAKNEEGFRRQFRMLRGDLGRLCRNQIGASYTRGEALQQSDYLYTTFDLNTGRALNFAICRDMGKNNKTLYIQVICSVLGGKNLLQYIIADARARGKVKIMLAALPTVINFYRKFGFNPGKQCGEDPEIAKVELATGAKSKLVRTYDDVEKDRMYKVYLRNLIKKGLASDPKCRYVDDCNIDGYYMTLCLKR